MVAKGSKSFVELISSNSKESTQEQKDKAAKDKEKAESNTIFNDDLDDSYEKHKTRKNSSELESLLKKESEKASKPSTRSP